MKNTCRRVWDLQIPARRTSAGNINAALRFPKLSAAQKHGRTAHSLPLAKEGGKGYNKPVVQFTLLC